MNTYTIKEVSAMFELPASTLRYYEEAGLLTNIQRSTSGQRIYEECHLHRLRTICCFKHAGMPITALQAFFSYDESNVEDISNISQLLIQHEAHIVQELATLQEDLIHIRKKIHYYEDIQKAYQNNQPKPEWKDYR